jgi:peptidoglycan/LPS O-acetylase OafA/YrhL
MASFAELDRDRNNNFDFLRLALSVAVIFSHCYLLTGSTAEPFNRLVHGQALLGWTAVNFFFAISGYLITSSWLRCKGSVDYLRRRVLRIHPGFIVAVFFCFLIAAPLGADHAVEYFHRPTAYLSLLLPVFYSSTVAVSFPHNPLPGVVNGSLWTIPCEFLMYLLVMLLGLIGVVRRRWLVLGLFIAVLIGHRSLGRFAPPLAAMHLPYFGFVHVLLRLSTYFLAGMTLRVFHDRIPHSLVLFIASLLVLLACQRRGLDNFLPVLGFTLFSMSLTRASSLCNTSEDSVTFRTAATSTHSRFNS